jgi:hypothetical protein
MDSRAGADKTRHELRLPTDLCRWEYAPTAQELADACTYAIS